MLTRGFWKEEFESETEVENVTIQEVVLLHRSLEIWVRSEPTLNALSSSVKEEHFLSGNIIDYKQKAFVLLPKIACHSHSAL